MTEAPVLPPEKTPDWVSAQPYKIQFRVFYFLGLYMDPKSM